MRSLQVLSSFEASSSEGIRSLILQQQSPIHSYLFDREGHLITANLKAKAWLESKGKSHQNIRKVVSSDLFHACCSPGYIVLF